MVVQSATCRGRHASRLPGREGEDGFVEVRVSVSQAERVPSRGVFRSLTVAFEALSDEPKQHLPAVVAEGRSAVRVHVERVRPNLEIFKGGCSWKETQKESEVTVGIMKQSTVLKGHPEVRCTAAEAAHSPESTTSTRSPSWMSLALFTSCRMLLVEGSCLNSKILS